MGGFAILPRTIDKCRASLAGSNGDYNFDCPLDKMLFGFKGINAPDFKDFVAAGHSDEEIAQCARLGLDPAKTTLFDYLEVDDKASFNANESCQI